MCSESSPPRISFSHWIEPSKLKQDSSISLLDSGFEFDISTKSINQKFSSAGELFSRGVILPTQTHQERFLLPRTANQCESTSFSSHPPLPPTSNKDQKVLEKGLMFVSSELAEEKSQSKSFWGFKRNSSLNCDSKRSSFLSLPLLSRSKSTGSVPKLKRTTTLKDVESYNSHKQATISVEKISSWSLFPSSSSSSKHLKPPLRKNHGETVYRSYVLIGPVLNVPPPPHISKAYANVLGLGCFLGGGADKKSKK